MSSTDIAKVDFDKVNEIILSCGPKKSNVIAILQKIQEEFRYLPEDALTYIGTKIEGLSPATVYGVATFYNQFSLDPKGKYIIRVCDGTACHVRGSMPLLTALKAKLNLKEGKFTTDDMMFTVEIVSCLGACSLSPVIVVNGKVYPKMTTDALKIVVDTLLKQERGE
ncbi:MAG TPA: NAD(P)H-dependent oxidoreductase subunit E [Candidatus Gastranaerophilaceae bacterium]|nr:NAD(P)H-dependent oxidoreductase subunit E [Candidatus Gastranaerophilaceae bacterium]HPT41246.1 NAD(P)H-dependent oxidoreductase subunit E [Candidatus Gastranaerophilaceae bacterium]